jgi:hypothetical protein
MNSIIGIADEKDVTRTDLVTMMSARLASLSDCGGTRKLTHRHLTTLIDTGAHYTDGRKGLVSWFALRFDS